MFTLPLPAIFTRKPAPVVTAQPEIVVSVGDFVGTVRGFGIVTAIDTPYCDGIQRAFVEGISWTDWMTIEDIL